MHNYPSKAAYNLDSYHGDMADRAKKEANESTSYYESSYDRDRRRQREYDMSTRDERRAEFNRDVYRRFLAREQQRKDYEVAEAGLPAVAELKLSEMENEWNLNWSSKIGQTVCTSCYVCNLGNAHQAIHFPAEIFYLHKKEDNLPTAKRSGRCCECQVYRDTYWVDRYSVGLRWLYATECWDKTRRLHEYERLYKEELKIIRSKYNYPLPFMRWHIGM